MLFRSEPPTLTRVVTANATMNGTIQPRQLLSSWVWPSCDAPLPSSCVSVSYALCTEDGCSSPTAIAASQANLSISLQHPQLLDYNGRVWLEYSATNLVNLPSEPARTSWLLVGDGAPAKSEAASIVLGPSAALQALSSAVASLADFQDTLFDAVSFKWCVGTAAGRDDLVAWREAATLPRDMKLTLATLVPDYVEQSGTH